MQKLLRHGAQERRLDRFLVAGIIEARSHERLELLASGLEDKALARFYAELAQSEEGHSTLFERLAAEVAEPATVAARLDFLLSREAELLKALPLRAAVH
jgi:tRNA-(ms[2]io[6]A)-hydroxylase